MKEVKELIKAAGTILKQAIDVAEDYDEHEILTVFGFPLNVCPDELLEKYLKSRQKLNGGDFMAGIGNDTQVMSEINKRRSFGIKIVRGSND